MRDYRDGMGLMMDRIRENFVDAQYPAEVIASLEDRIETDFRSVLTFFEKTDNRGK